MVGTGVAAGFGVLIKGGDILEKINGINRIVFDKTGTLTSGQPLVKHLISVNKNFKINPEVIDDDTLYYYAYLAEKSSEHPLAKAIVKDIESKIPGKLEELGKRHTTKEFKNIDGEGVKVIVNCHEQNKEMQILCGNDKLVKTY
jgi:Cu+-exporting ATPase